jgi:hypothetical protein
MHARPDDSKWPGPSDLVPPELLQMREWLHEMFQTAGKGLPWPHQMSLMLIEQAITIGMFGGVLGSAWAFAQRTGQLPDPRQLDLGSFLASLESSATDALPDQVQVAIRHVQAHLVPGGLEKTVEGLWDQFWRGDGLKPPFPTFGDR